MKELVPTEALDFGDRGSQTSFILNNKGGDICVPPFDGSEEIDNNLMYFDYETHQVRTVIIEDEPWWVASDVCTIFGETNRNRAMRNLDDDEKGYTRLITSGGVQTFTIVNEAGLYALLFAMQPKKGKARGIAQELMEERLANLRAFKRWVTHEVLPQIRKTGSYSVRPKLTQKDLASTEHVLAVIEALHSEVVALQGQVEDQIVQIEEMQPKASYYDLVLQSPDAVTITTIAKDYGWSGQSMNAKLHELGVQFKQGSIWHLYQKYAGQGYTTSKTGVANSYDGSSGTYIHTCWTQKGRLFIYKLLKEIGYVPLIEQAVN